VIKYSVVFQIINIVKFEEKKMVFHVEKVKIFKLKVKIFKLKVKTITQPPFQVK